MRIKYSVKLPTPDENPGIWNENGRVKLDAKGLKREQVLRLSVAINEALSK